MGDFNMSTMKMFIKYLILFLLLYVFVNIVSYAAIRTSYGNITDYNIEFSEPTVTINEAKTTQMNGYVKGNVKNSTSEAIQNKYIKIDFITKNNNVLTSKYIDVYQLGAGQSKDFNIKYEAEKITSFKMYLTDNKPENTEKLWPRLAYLLAGGFLVY